MAGATLSLVVGHVTIACSNVDRVVFPDLALTKGDVIAYYRDVAPLLLPHVAERPLTVERFTKGVAGGGFFQKHRQKHFPPYIGSVEMGGKTKVTYPVVTDAAGIVYLANQGALSFHVPTSRADDVLSADHVVFDLDPSTDFDQARTAAHVVREELDRLGLASFVKLTGGKGLHVVTPITPASYAHVERFTASFAKRMCSAHPDLFTTEFYKKDRAGRLFLDILRNMPAATAIAPWSLRGKPNAPVAVPIAWQALNDFDLRPDGVTLRDVGFDIDPWSAWSASRRALPR